MYTLLQLALYNGTGCPSAVCVPCFTSPVSYLPSVYKTVHFGDKIMKIGQEVSVIDFYMFKPGTIMYHHFQNTLYELRHDKTKKMSVCPAKTQISLGIRLVRSESSLSP